MTRVLIQQSWCCVGVSQICLLCVLSWSLLIHNNIHKWLMASNFVHPTLTSTLKYRRLDSTTQTSSACFKVTLYSHTLSTSQPSAPHTWAISSILCLWFMESQPTLYLSQKSGNSPPPFSSSPLIFHLA